MYGKEKTTIALNEISPGTENNSSNAKHKDIYIRQITIGNFQSIGVAGGFVLSKRISTKHLLNIAN